MIEMTVGTGKNARGNSQIQGGGKEEDCVDFREDSHLDAKKSD